jgi:hypothetical protein
LGRSLETPLDAAYRTSDDVGVLCTTFFDDEAGSLATRVHGERVP